MVDRASILPLRLHGASVTRLGKRLFGPVDHEFGPAGFTLIVGPNGAGKTTLLRMIHGLERCGPGRLDWSAERPVVHDRQAFVFQTPRMMRRSALDNLTYPLLVHGARRSAARAAAMGWLDRLGLAAAAHRPAAALSGGERQKLALARALIRKPQLLLLDEPCASLDGRATREIEDMLRAALAAGTRIVMATHDMGQARRLADDVLFIHGGAIIESAPAARFFDNPGTPQARAYLNGDILE
jgi:tungstate transport system ATP-binding protein